MPYYNYLKYDFRNTPARDFVIEKIIELRKQLNKEIPDKDSENNLLLATWNIRDFNKNERRGFGKRTADSFYYIAEIISAFDLVAVQEVNELFEWEKVMNILGSSWDYIATDVADIRAGGNGERMVFVYDKRKVWFKNVAGEVVLPSNLLISKTDMTVSDNKLFSGKQFRRTPFSVSFQSGWFKFDLCTVHIYYGQGKEGLEQRIEEISSIASYLSDRVDKIEEQYKRTTILLGDFNIIRPDHDTMKALEDNGFRIPKNIKSRKSNVINTMHYDQIAFKSSDEILNYADIVTSDSKTSNSGVLQVMHSVFQNTDEDFDFYKPEVLKSKNSDGLNDAELREYYKKDWRTYQMSDHNLMWVKLKTNDSEKFLKGLVNQNS